MEPTPAPQRQTLAGMQAGHALAAHAPETRLPAIAPGFDSMQSFELLVRQAKALSSSTLVPTQYRQIIQKVDRDNNPKGPAIENANAIPNCMIALNMATRMRADPLMVMQNLIIVEGRPSWSSQWVIAQINNCGRFEPLRFDLQELGPEDVEYEYTEWGQQRGERARKKATVRVDNVMCTAWTVQKGVVIPPGVQTIADAKRIGLPILKGPKVTVAMAVKEGWYTKSGSKWQTMPELMLHYRSGAFFGRLYAPELLMGIPTDDEVRDMGMLVQGADGTFAPTPAPAAGEADPLNPTIDALRKSAQAHAGGDEPHEGGDEAGSAEGDHGAAREGAAEAGTPGELKGQPQAEKTAEKPKGSKAASTPAASPAPQPTGGDDMFGSVD